ncbi:hypothetical protein AAEU42_13115 [Pseudoflavonifractor phocaeensis]|uniref:hypothetical protein n=1 Tax=Pseudoflavonifractor phocaeensis TaxID=1870988 RepID=UPI00313BA88B
MERIPGLGRVERKGVCEDAVAEIGGGAGKSVFQIDKWLGLNESPDGDTGLKNGEAAQMRNFRVTRERHLQIRPGYAPVCVLAQGQPVRGLWRGYVDGQIRLLAACGGHLWSVDPAGWSKTDLGEIADAPTSFFGFAKKVYLLTGEEYYCWDGTGQVKVVEGYVPIVATATVPSGGGTLLEQVNKLTGLRRQQFSPDGTAKDFMLVETGIDEIVKVEGTGVSYTVDKGAGKVSFASAPAKGTNTVTITWRKGEGDRGKVTGMRFSELFNGASDSRVFLYGDGTNEAVYSGLDETGQATAEYFPDLNTMAVDSANTPITGMIRHYDRLLVFKPDSAYSAQYGTLTLADGSATAAFYASALNREIGCSAPGQVRLVKNNPRTLFGSACYEWALAIGSTRDERNAKRLSDPVTATLAAFALEQAVTFDDEAEQEYYVVCADRAIVHNYGCDAWYYYTNVPMTCLEKVGDGLYFGTPDGRLMEFSRRYRNDDLEPIDAYWESGSMAFEREWMRKYSSLVWVGIKPETQAVLYMTAQSNIKSDYPVKVIASGLSNFTHASFAHWSFGTNRKPQVIRAKLKVKKATFYKLILYSKSASATATILSVDVQVRYTGNVK